MFISQLRGRHFRTSRYLVLRGAAAGCRGSYGAMLVRTRSLLMLSSAITLVEVFFVLAYLYPTSLYFYFHPLCPINCMKLLPLTAFFLFALLTCGKAGAQDSIMDKTINENFEQLKGGWYGKIEERSVFLELDSNGWCRINLDGGIHEFYYLVKNVTPDKLIVKEISQGRHYVSGVDVSNMSDDEAQKKIDDLYTHELGYSLDLDSLTISLANESFSLKKCENADCRGVKPDNMRFSEWSFDFKLVRVKSTGWTPLQAQADKNDFLTLAKPVQELHEIADNAIKFFTPMTPGLRAEDVEYLHTAAVNGCFNLLLDQETKLSEIEVLLRDYRSVYPETKFFIVGLNDANETVRRLIELDDFRDADIDVTAWAGTN